MITIAQRSSLKSEVVDRYFIAIEENDIELVKEICHEYPTIYRELTSSGKSGAFYAARYGHLEMLQFILGIPKKDSKRDFPDYPSLYTAAVYGGASNVLEYLFSLTKPICINMAREAIDNGFKFKVKCFNMIMTEGRLAYKMRLNADYHKKINPPEGLPEISNFQEFRRRLFVPKSPEDKNYIEIAYNKHLLSTKEEQEKIFDISKLHERMQQLFQIEKFKYFLYLLEHGKYNEMQPKTKYLLSLYI